MAIRELTKEEYLATFSAPMRRLEENENYRPISLRDYVLECIQFLKLDTTLELIEIHHVYLSNDKLHSHVLFYYGQRNRYLVIIVDHDSNSVKGYYLLDLNQEYGLAPT